MVRAILCFSYLKVIYAITDIYTDIPVIPSVTENT